MFDIIGRFRSSLFGNVFLSASMMWLLSGSQIFWSSLQQHFLGYMYKETFPKQPTEFNVACRQMISAINI